MSINYDEWAAFLESVDVSDDALNVKEWAAKLGKSINATHGWLKRGLEAEWIETAAIVRTQLNGVTKRYVGFRLNGRSKK